jgi:phasin family protein
MASNTPKTASPSSTPPVPGLPSPAGLGLLFERFKVPGFDIDALAEWQRKDLEALAEANRQAYEGVRALAQRRGEILQASLAQWQEALKSIVGSEALSRNAEAAKRGVEQAIDHFRELAEMEMQARSSTWKVVQDRLQETIANLQGLLQPR